MKKLIEKVILRLFPELAGGYHLPQLAVVATIPDPPTGEAYTDHRPYYAVDIRLLTSTGNIDAAMPLIRDVPVAMTGAADQRGFASLPQPGTIVELAYAFGLQNKPFIRSILPYNLKLPAIDADSQKWQQSDESFQLVDGAGNWTRQTSAEITDIATQIYAGNANQSSFQSMNRDGDWNRKSSSKIKDIAPKIYIGNQSNNLLVLDTAHMTQLINALAALSEHTHPHPMGETDPPRQKDIIKALKQEVELIKNKLDEFTEK